MKLKQWLSVLLAACFVLTGCLAFVGCQTENGDGKTTTGGTTTTDIGGTTQGITTDPTGTTGPVVTTPEDPVDPIDDGPTLASLTLNNGASINFSSDEGSYVVVLPTGRPAVPQITATATDEGAEVTVYQAMFPNDATEAFGRVDVALGEESNTYWVKFIKHESAGFVLQYEDRYTFTPDYTLADGESFTFESSNTGVISVDGNGILTVKKVSDEAVTVTASVNGEVKDTLVVSHTDHSQMALFIVAGQSNACGTFDDAGNPLDYSKQTDPICPDPGVSLFMSVLYASPAQSDVYDMAEHKPWGFSPALATKWYELTGEKTFIIQGAVGGAPIEVWQKGGDKYAAVKANLYDGTLTAYNQVMATYGENSNYEFIRTGYFWLQGETGQSALWENETWNFNVSDSALQTGEEYFDIFMENHANFQKDFGAEFGSIAIVRSLYGVCSEESQKLGLLTDLVPVRAAQYMLNSNTDRTVFVASRIGEIAAPKYSKPSSGRIEHDPTLPGYGYMGVYNLHYSQEGYNAEGTQLAIGTYNMLCATVDRTATGIEVLASDGRTRLTDGATVQVSRQNGYQLAAAVLPLWAEGTSITYTVTEGANICSVSSHGLVTFNDGVSAGKTAKVAITNEENGFTLTVNVVCD